MAIPFRVSNKINYITKHFPMNRQTYKSMDVQLINLHISDNAQSLTNVFSAISALFNHLFVAGCDQLEIVSESLSITTGMNVYVSQLRDVNI